MSCTKRIASHWFRGQQHIRGFPYPERYINYENSCVAVSYRLTLHKNIDVQKTHFIVTNIEYKLWVIKKPTLDGCTYSTDDDDNVSINTWICKTVQTLSRHTIYYYFQYIVHLQCTHRWQIKIMYNEDSVPNLIPISSHVTAGFMGFSLWGIICR